MIELRTHESIADIGAAEWDALAGDEAPPFVTWPWLDALEKTGCVRPERGWLPMHVTIHIDGVLAAAAPAYVKGNSEGEFVFDHSWARFCGGQLGRDYYPKLIVAVPFTPATGPRLLVADGFDRKRIVDAFASGLGQLMDRVGLSSVHVLFPGAEEARELVSAGMAHRHGVQYHWRNADYGSFDDFLARFNSKRRNQIRRERRALAEQGTAIEVLSGADLTTDVVDAAYEFYLSTVNKFYWGRQYLNRGFFHEVCSRMADSVQVVLARDASSRRPIAGAFNLVGGDALYGRYWGAVEERPCLHFNVCYYAGIEECIHRGLKLFEPGAGGEHKLARGFEPTVTHSAHLLGHRVLDDAVREFVQREQEAIADHLAYEKPVLKPRA